MSVAPTGVRLAVADHGRCWAVVDRDGVLVAYASLPHAVRLVRLAHALELSPEQLQRLLGEGRRGGRLLHTITLQHRAVCRRCGRTIPVGEHARWNPTTGLAQHPRRCPAAATRRRTARKAA